MKPEEKLKEQSEEMSQQNNLEGDSIEDKLTKLSFDLLLNSQVYKQPRMNTLIKYERMYLNDIPPKLRQLFNVPIPVFPGLVDTLSADFNDQIKLKFKETNPADYLVMPKVQAQFDIESSSTLPNAMWNYKARTDRFNAIISGRSILKEFAESDPKYKNVLNVTNYSDFHCQPLGGGHLENHLFAGEEGVFRNLSEIIEDDFYPLTQRNKLKTQAWTDDFFTSIETTYGTRLQRFKSQGLDVESNTFSGDRVLNLCEFVVTYKGQRYLVLFEPLTRIWLRVEKWDDLFPWVSAATHEDDKNFWSKSYADDFYYVADATITLFNQELTNREKKNFNARAFDPEMFTDTAKLDAAQYRPDALVPVVVPAGKNIANGIYQFQTGELSGTINLIQFANEMLGKSTGVNDLSQGSVGGSKKPAIIMAQQQQMAKRIGLRSDSFQEMYAQLGMRYYKGLRKHMPSSLAVRMIGENGFIEERELRRMEIKNAAEPEIIVISTSEQENADNIKRDAKAKAIGMIVERKSQNTNGKWIDEHILRDIGQFEDSEVAFALDAQDNTSKKQIAHASRAIQDILLNREPEIYYGADESYMQYIHNYVIDNKSNLKGKYKKFFEFSQKVAPVVAMNVKSKAQQMNRAAKGKGGDGQPANANSADPNAAQPQPNSAGPGAAARVAQKIGQAK